MKIASFVGLILFSLAATPVKAQSLEGVVRSGVTPQRLSGGFVFTEGPAVDAKGNVFFTDIPNERIHVWDVFAAKLTTVREKSGRANGLFFDAEGNLVACEGGNRQLTRSGPGGKWEVLAKRFRGKRLNSPNDLWIDPKGGIYFTDPRYGSEDDLEQDGFHTYYLKPGKELVRVTNDLVKPNGIIGTSDGRTLYIADPGARTTYRYEITGDGTLSNKQLFAKSGSDGMTLDSRGNLYLTSGGVIVFNAKGEKLGVIEVPERPANVCFGGRDHKTLFITARTSLYALQMNVEGQRSPGLKP